LFGVWIHETSYHATHWVKFNKKFNSGQNEKVLLSNFHLVVITVKMIL